MENVKPSPRRVSLPKKKSTRGRRPGHLGKAHKDVHENVFTWWQKLSEGERKKLIATGTTPEQIEYWRHNEAADRGNYPLEVATAATQLGTLVERYKKILVEKRWNLEANRRVEIPLPFLPAGEIFDKSEINLLHQTGHDALWTMQGSEYPTALSLLSFLIRAAANSDVKFFEELARRIRSSFVMGVPLTSGAEPVYGTMIGLKRMYNGFDGGFVKEPPADKRQWDANSSFHAYLKRILPKLFPVLLLPPKQRPPLTVAQIREFVCEHGKLSSSDRALIRAAKIMGIPVAGRGRPKNGT
jgi:hypothetical protein